MSLTNVERSRWDPVVKLTHWSIVAAVLANAVFTEEGSNVHIWVGYALAAILGLRLLWGLIGPAEARFTAFLPSVKRARDHMREITNGVKSEHRSHNPLGALMVYAIWSCLLAIIVTGVAMAGLPVTPQERAAPEAVSAIYAERGEDSEHEGEEENEGLAAEIHETAANLLYLLILLHLAGVLFESRRSGREVILAMIPGRR